MSFPDLDTIPCVEEINTWAAKQLQSSAEEIAASTFLNCHVPSVTSLRFGKLGESTIRMFIALPGNQLHHNDPDLKLSYDLTVPFHAHRRDIALVMMKGELTNWIIEPVSTEPEFLLESYYWDSPILNGRGGYRKGNGIVGFRTAKVETLQASDRISMGAREIHSVSVPADLLSAWYIVSQAYDSEATTENFANFDLTKFEQTDLYQPCSVEQLIAYAELIGLR